MYKILIRDSIIRRCQNLSIVGKEVKNIKRNQYSSHGSSGIGSDLAPSPERHEEEISTSSSGKLSLCDGKLRETFDPHLFADDWKHEGRDGFNRKVEKVSPTFDEKLSPTRYRDNPPSYIFPKEPSREFKAAKQMLEKSYRGHEVDQPIVAAKKQVKADYIHENKKHFVEPTKPKAHVEDDRRINSGFMRQQSERYRDVVDHRHSQNYEKYERENLTDRQKYREIMKNEKYQKHEPMMRGEVHRSKRDSSPEHVRTIQRKSQERYEVHEERSKHKIPDGYKDRNPYRQPDSLPYRESIENMLRSPDMKYKSRIPYERSPPREAYQVDPHAQRKPSNRNYSNQDRDLYIKDSSPMSTMKKTSPKDRFQDAKEKFQAMDKIRLQQEMKPSLGVRRSEPPRYEKDYRQSYSPEPRYHHHNEWSSEEEFAPNMRDYRDHQSHQQYRQQKLQQQQRIMVPAKSLGNLAKGYRHSYAEPIKYCGIGRVGLAAIEPY